MEARVGVVHGDVDHGSRGEHDRAVGRCEGRHGGVGGDAEVGGWRAGEGHGW